jgi:sugar O-acyltransferase (sialic acid O-acetyltransferase NeuD family)
LKIRQAFERSAELAPMRGGVMESTITNIPNIKKKVFIWGASGHALFVMNILSFFNNIEVIGLVDDINFQNIGNKFNGYTVMGGKEILPDLKKQGVTGCIFGFGNCSARYRLGEYALSEGFELISAIHPHTSIASSASIGTGVVIGPAVVVDANCIIEDNCILNNSCCVSHGTSVGSGSHICPGVIIGGDVTIGKCSWIGIGSTIIQKTTVGSGTFIGAGSLVTKNIPDSVLSYGAPARIIKEISNDF